MAQALSASPEDELISVCDAIRLYVSQIVAHVDHHQTLAAVSAQWITYRPTPTMAQVSSKPSVAAAEFTATGAVNVITLSSESGAVKSAIASPLDHIDTSILR